MLAANHPASGASSQQPELTDSATINQSYLRPLEMKKSLHQSRIIRLHPTLPDQQIQPLLIPHILSLQRASFDSAGQTANNQIASARATAQTGEKSPFIMQMMRKFSVYTRTSLPPGQRSSFQLLLTPSLIHCQIQRRQAPCASGKQSNL